MHKLQHKKGSSELRSRSDTGSVSSRMKSTSCRPMGAGSELARPSATDGPDGRSQVDENARISGERPLERGCPGQSQVQSHDVKRRAMGTPDRHAKGTPHER